MMDGTLNIIINYIADRIAERINFFFSKNLKKLNSRKRAERTASLILYILPVYNI